MTTPINPTVLKELVSQFPNRFSSKAVTRLLREKGYNYVTTGGQLANHFRNFGFVNDYPGSKMWMKKKPVELFKMTAELLTDDELLAEIKRRGYTGTLNPPLKSIIL